MMLNGSILNRTKQKPQNLHLYHTKMIVILSGALTKNLLNAAQHEGASEKKECNVFQRIA